MPEILSGEVIAVPGSASQPYQLRNLGGVLSCTCPVWKNQSLSIDRRTCKHLRYYCGDAAEAVRLGRALPARAEAIRTQPQPPPLLLAETWDGERDPTGWLVSEKLDGVRAWWDGRRFLSRQGLVYHAPAWFIAGLPLVPLDGELWLGRGQFAQTVSILRRADAGLAWRQVRFVVFDAPGESGPFTARLAYVRLVMQECQPPHAEAHPHTVCASRRELDTELARVLALGGEGLMLRQPVATYTAGRSPTLLKVKGSREVDARVVGHAPGRGRHRGRLGALQAVLANGVSFAVGSGLSDADREQPPDIGAVITVRYQELTTGGVPRFPVFVRVRTDLTSLTLARGEPQMVTTQPGKRRFEFVGGTSAKFWEVESADVAVSVRFGRLGTQGQEQTKTLPDTTAAWQHVDKLIREKLAKGYVEVV